MLKYNSIVELQCFTLLHQLLLFTFVINNSVVINSCVLLLLLLFSCVIYSDA